MKCRVKKFTVVILVISLLMVGCSGGGNKSEETASKKEEVTTVADDKVDTSEFVKLKMYLFGDKAPDTDKVYAEINKMLKEDINAEVEVAFMSWGDYEQRYPLAFASGEDFDIAYAASWAFYNAQATKGGFLEIKKDMLEKYAPKTAETIYKDAWEQAKVDGKVFMLPMNYKELFGYTYMMRGDLMEKYNITEVNSFDDFAKYLDVIAKNEPQMIPVDVGSEFDWGFVFDRLWEETTHNEITRILPKQLSLYIKNDDPTSGVIHVSEYPGYAEILKKIKGYKDAGYWSKSALVNKVTSKESFMSGKSASVILNFNDAKGTYTSIVNAHPEWNVKVFDAQGDVPAKTISFLGNGMGIHAKSKNPERSLMLLDLLRNDERYHDLMSFGIEGVHYEKNDDKTITPLDLSSNYPVDGNCNWGIRNDKFWKEIKGGIPNYKEIHDKWIANTEPEKMLGFNFNDSNVKNEVATMTNINKTEDKAFRLGFVEDVDEAIPDLKKKYELAGIEKIKKEMDKQIKEYFNR